MALTTEVQLGAFTIPISSAAAEELDKYNIDDQIFSEEDVDGNLELAIDLFVGAMAAHNEPYRNLLTNLITAVNLSDRLAQYAARFREMHPEINRGRLPFFANEVEFTPEQWAVIGGIEVFRQIAHDADNLIPTVALALASFNGKGVLRPWRGVCASGNLWYYEFNRIEYPHLVSMLLQLEDSTNYASAFFEQAEQLECEGNKCPNEDEVEYALYRIRLGQEALKATPGEEACVAASMAAAAMAMAR